MPKKKSKKRIDHQSPIGEKVFRAIIFILLGVLVVFIILQLATTLFINGRVKEYLQTEIYEKTRKEYKLDIGELRINLFNQSVFIRDMKLTADKKIHPEKPKYFAEATKIKLVDFKLFAYLFKKDLIFDKIVFVKPVGKIYRNKKESDKNQQSPKYTSFRMISKHLHAFVVRKIIIKNADVNFYEDIGDILPSIKSQDNLFKILNLRINSASDHSQRWFFTDSVQITINRFKYETKNTLYSVRVKKLVASSNDSTLLIDSIQVIPKYSKHDFGYKAGKQTDRMSISVAQALFTNINIKLFIERNSFIARKLETDRFILEAYRDKNIEGKPKRAKSLQELIKSVPNQIRLDSIHIKNSHITYEEVPKGATVPGKLFFSHINGWMTGVTNDKSLINKKSMMVFNASARLMDAAPMLAHYDFPLETDSMVFDCSGKMTGFDLKNINPTLEPLAFISMQNGVVDTLVFNFHADEKAANGKMEVVYHDLKIKLTQDPNVKYSNFKKLTTLPSKRILVIVLLKRNNPIGNRPVRVTEIHLERNSEKFIFNYTWKSLLSGIKPAIGLPSKTHKIKEPPPK